MVSIILKSAKTNALINYVNMLEGITSGVAETNVQMSTVNATVSFTRENVKSSAIIASANASKNIMKEIAETNA